ncbi:hypothetical protein FRB99_002648 [Tulasnella sp. 403]|nr:hypothetical protein FRB99_002648 [Tulasnella sp. 403]
MHAAAGRAPPTGATMKRIHREIRDLEKEDMGEITLKPSETSVFQWTATIPGPSGSVYEGGVFKLSIVLPSDYPFSSPRVTFDTRIYHMNIASTGAICIDVLKSQWSPALSLFKVLLSISSLLTDPNPQDPLVPSIAMEYMRDRAVHDATAREWTCQYAMPPEPVQPKGKGKAPARPPPPPTTSRPGPPTRSLRSTGSRNANATEVIELLSDGEEAPPPSHEPIIIDDDDEVSIPPPVANARPPRRNTARTATRPDSSSRHPARSQRVVGVKRQHSSGPAEEAAPSASSSNRETRTGTENGGRTGRASKRRAFNTDAPTATD